MYNEQKFSVAMSVYGKDNPIWVEEAIDSLYNQTRIPDEIVLVVDGPVSQEINVVIKKYEYKPQFKVIRLGKNQGHGNARRTGLCNCTYELVALMDADDISMPDRFEKQLAAFDKDSDVAILGGNIAEFIDDTNNIVGYRTVEIEDRDIKNDLKKRCPFNQMTVMLNKEKVDASGGYIDWYCNEDYYLWIRMYLKNFKFANIDDVLVKVRVGEDMYQRRGGWKYFKSEYNLQKFMFSNHIIKIDTFVINVLKRLIVQVLMPNTLRGWVFKKFARKQST